jgi:hypothetical protein
VTAAGNGCPLRKTHTPCSLESGPVPRSGRRRGRRRRRSAAMSPRSSIGRRALRNRSCVSCRPSSASWAMTRGTSPLSSAGTSEPPARRRVSPRGSWLGSSGLILGRSPPGRRTPYPAPPSNQESLRALPAAPGDPGGTVRNGKRMAMRRITPRKSGPGRSMGRRPPKSATAAGAGPPRRDLPGPYEPAAEETQDLDARGSTMSVFEHLVIVRVRSARGSGEIQVPLPIRGADQRVFIQRIPFIRK